MHIRNAMLQRRSIRKFRPQAVPYDQLRDIVDISRLYPSGGNQQPLRFCIVNTPELTDPLFSLLRWAMYLPGYSIAADERPTAYIVILRDDRISHKCDYDVGAASTSIMLAAVAQGLASCPIGNCNWKELTRLLQFPEELKPELVLALGYPAQESHVVPMQGSIKYQQDDAGNFLVPKYSTEELLVPVPSST